MAHLFALVAAGGLAGCGGGDVGQVEQRLRSELSAQLDRPQALAQPEYGHEEVPAPTVARVDCPDDAKPGPGASFRCRALAPGGRLVGTLTVTMLAGGRPAWQFTAAGAP